MRVLCYFGIWNMPNLHTNIGLCVTDLSNPITFYEQEQNMNINTFAYIIQCDTLLEWVDLLKFLQPHNFFVLFGRLFDLILAWCRKHILRSRTHKKDYTELVKQVNTSIGRNIFTPHLAQTWPYHNPLFRCCTYMEYLWADVIYIQRARNMNL